MSAEIKHPPSVTASGAVLLWCGITIGAYLYIAVLAFLVSVATNFEFWSFVVRGSHLIILVAGGFFVVPVLLRIYCVPGMRFLAWTATFIAVGAPLIQAYRSYNYAQSQLAQGIVVEGWGQFVGFAPWMTLSILLSFVAQIFLGRAWQANQISITRYVVETAIMSGPLSAWLLLASYPLLVRL